MFEPHAHTHAVPAVLQRGVAAPQAAAQHTLPVPAMFVTQFPLLHCAAAEQLTPLSDLATQVPALHHWPAAHWPSFMQAPHDIVVVQ